MRLRRLSGKASFGSALDSMRDIASKSKASPKPDPTAAFRCLALRPASERSKSALRMSESFCTTRSRSLRKRSHFCFCTAAHACCSRREGNAASQSASSPSTLTAARARRRLSSIDLSAPDLSVPDLSVLLPRRPAALCQSAESVPLAPPAASVRISCSSRRTCLLMRSPSLPRAATPRAPSMSPDSDCTNSLSARSATSTSGKS